MKLHITLAVAAALTLVGCDKKEENSQVAKKVEERASNDAKKATESLVDSTKKSIKESVEDVKEAANDIKDKTVVATKEATDTTKEVANKVIDSANENIVKPTKEVVSSAVDKTKEVANDVADKTKEVANNVVDKTKEVTKKAVDTVSGGGDTEKGKALFAPCIACHGSNAEKKALGKSQIIADWSKENIAEALEGYKNKTYGGAMKGIMYGQVSKLSKAQMEDLAAYIVTLKK